MFRVLSAVGLRERVRVVLPQGLRVLLREAGDPRGGHAREHRRAQEPREGRRAQDAGPPPDGPEGDLPAAGRTPVVADHRHGGLPLQARLEHLQDLEPPLVHDPGR